RAEQIFVGAAAAYVTSPPPGEVPGAYTRAGWSVIRAHLAEPASPFAVEPWVLGGAGDVKTASSERLREMYFDKYVRAWKDFFAGLEVATPVSVEDALAELRALDSVENGPYIRLFRTLAENARLDMSPPRLADKVVA